MPTRQGKTTVYLVTGASSGIGRATALALATRGHQVIGVARNPNALATLRTDHADLIRPCVADLSTDEGLQAVADACRPQGLAGIVHGAASVIAAEPYLDIDPETLVADMRLHVAAPMRLHHVLADAVIGTRIVYLDSFAATEARIGWAGYSIVKAAAQMAARAAAAELPATILRVFPGGVRTPVIDSIIHAEHDTPARTLYRQLDQEGKLSDPPAIGEYIARLLLEASDSELVQSSTWTYPDLPPRA